MNNQIKSQVRETVVTALGLALEPEQIGFEDPLFEGRLGLDSVDLVTAIVAVEKRFGLDLADDPDLAQHFQSIAAISEVIEKRGFVPK